VLFTSANGVERFFAQLGAREKDARAFGRARVGVIGPKTRLALERFGVRADVMAEKFVGESLAAALLERALPGRVLLPRALVARDALPDALRARGFTVDVVAAYETRPAPAATREALVRALSTGDVDVAIFTSSSTVTETLAVLGDRATELLGRVTVGSIGPITTRTLADNGVRVDVTAESFTIEGLLLALERHFSAANTAV
jgi:uroporphyrinogen III methyltransferase/synthase